MIDTSTWKEFRVGDLFEFESIKQAKSQRAVPDDINGIPYVVQSKYNNMVVRYVNKQWLIDNNEPPVKGNAIALGVTLNCVSYQEKEFGASQIITARNDNLNCYIGNFVATILTYATERFTYKEKPGLQKYKDTIIKLPATSDGQPDWDYMESYMKTVMEESEKSLENLKKADDTKHLIDVSGWGEFRVGDLFDIHPTKAYKLTNAQLLDDGNYPVIANSAYNNGIGGYSTRKPTEQGNMVTFSDTVDANTIFYQKEPFVGYPHVQGLYPIKYEDKWNELTYQFFVSVFRGTALVKGFDYGNKFRRDIAVELMVKLPITSTGEPDWQYMEDYMKVVMNKSEQIISDLQIGA